MASLNLVVLMGNLTRDPELRYTPGGAPVCNFDLAMNREYTTQAGEKKSEVVYMPVVVWGKQAESSGQYLKKGRQALVHGRLQNRSWETPEGQKRTKTEVVADNVQFMGGNSGSKDAQAPAAEEPAAPVGAPAPGAPEDDLPF